MMFNVKKSDGTVVNIIPQLVKDCPVIRRHRRDEILQYIKDWNWEEEGIREQVLLNLDLIADIVIKESSLHKGLDGILREMFILHEFTGRSVQDCRRACSSTNTMGEAFRELMKRGIPLLQFRDEDKGRYPTEEEIVTRLFQEIMEEKRKGN